MNLNSNRIILAIFIISGLIIFISSNEPQAELIKSLIYSNLLIIIIAIILALVVANWKK